MLKIFLVGLLECSKTLQIPENYVKFYAALHLPTSQKGSYLYSKLVCEEMSIKDIRLFTLERLNCGAEASLNEFESYRAKNPQTTEAYIKGFIDQYDEFRLRFGSNQLRVDPNDPDSKEHDLWGWLCNGAREHASKIKDLTQFRRDHPQFWSFRMWIEENGYLEGLQVPSHNHSKTSFTSGSEGSLNFCKYHNRAVKHSEKSCYLNPALLHSSLRRFKVFSASLDLYLDA